MAPCASRPGAAGSRPPCTISRAVGAVVVLMLLSPPGPAAGAYCGERTLLVNDAGTGVAVAYSVGEGVEPGTVAPVGSPPPRVSPAAASAHIAVTLPVPPDEHELRFIANGSVVVSYALAADGVERVVPAGDGEGPAPVAFAYYESDQSTNASTLPTPVYHVDVFETDEAVLATLREAGGGESWGDGNDAVDDVRVQFSGPGITPLLATGALANPFACTPPPISFVDNLTRCAVGEELLISDADVAWWSTLTPAELAAVEGVGDDDAGGLLPGDAQGAPPLGYLVFDVACGGEYQQCRIALPEYGAAIVIDPRGGNVSWAPLAGADGAQEYPRLHILAPAYNTTTGIVTQRMWTDAALAKATPLEVVRVKPAAAPTTQVTPTPGAATATAAPVPQASGVEPAAGGSDGAAGTAVARVDALFPCYAAPFVDGGGLADVAAADEGDGLAAWEVALIVIAVMLCLMLIAAAVFLVVYRRRRQPQRVSFAAGSDLLELVDRGRPGGPAVVVSHPN